MEYVGQQSIRKICNFYVSDVHLSVMLIPYISREINKDVEITTIFEKLERQNVEGILEKLNIRNKEQILNINWFNGNKDTYEKINNLIEEDLKKHKKVTIIIGGCEEYILKNNKKVMQMLNAKESYFNKIEPDGDNYEVKIINCYNIEEVGNRAKYIVRKYDGLMNTSGEVPTSAIAL